MKSLIHTMFCYLLAGIVFVSSTGLGLVEHSCLMNGKKEMSMTSGKSCCSGKNVVCTAASAAKTTFQAEKCCKVETSYAHVDFSSSLVQVVSSLLASVCVAVLSTFSFLFNAFVESFTTSVNISLPPPLSGREWLILLQTFLI
ncbi:MAG: hypothetical protein V4714_21180 [Bacteroidota bacterium]